MMSYKAIVRPKLEYCSYILDPYQQKYVDQLEFSVELQEDIATYWTRTRTNSENSKW